MSVIGPECPGNLATLAPSLRSQIFITLLAKENKKSANIVKTTLTRSLALLFYK